MNFIYLGYINKDLECSIKKCHKGSFHPEKGDFNFRCYDDILYFWEEKVPKKCINEVKLKLKNKYGVKINKLIFIESIKSFGLQMKYIESCHA